MHVSALFLLVGSVSAGLLRSNNPRYFEPRAADTCSLGTPTDDGQGGCTHNYLQIGNVYYKNYCPGYIGGPQLGGGRSSSYTDCLTDCNNSPVCKTVLYTKGSCGFYGSGYTVTQASYIPSGVYVAQKLSSLPDSCITTPPLCTAGTSTLSGRVCTLSCSTDRPGGDYKALPVASFTACAAACAAESQCTTAQFSEANGYCYLKNARNPSTSVTGTDTVDCAPLDGPTTPTPATCSAGTSVLSGRECKTQCNTDRAGGDYQALRAASVAACGAACAADPLCQTAQYSEASGYCYLKNTRNAATSSTGTDTIDCEPSGGPTTTTPSPSDTCTNGSLTVNNRQCTVSCGMDRNGGDFAASQTGTLAACIQACAANSQCVSSQFVAASGFCYMKSTANALVANSQVTTVDCGSAPSVVDN